MLSFHNPLIQVDASSDAKNTLFFFFYTSTNCFCVMYCTIGHLPREPMQNLILRNKSSVNLYGRRMNTTFQVDIGSDTSNLK